MTGRSRAYRPAFCLLLPLRTSAWACALASGLTACGSAPDARSPAPAAGESAAAGSASPTTGASSPSAAAPPDGAEGAVTMLTPGEGPKRALRYVFHPDAKEALAMDMRMTMAMAMDGQQRAPVTLPPIRTQMAVDTARVTSEGDLVYHFVLRSVDSQDDGTADPRLKEALDHEMKKLTGLSGEAEVTTRGHTVRATMNVPAEAGEQVRDLLDELARAMKEITVPLPAEPVGRGAKWTATTPFHMKMFDATRTVTYTLSQTDGDRATIDYDVALTAPPQALHSQRLQDAHMTLDSMNASGRGRTRVDLQRLVPTSDVDTKIDVAMSIEAQGATHTMAMKTQIGVHVAPSP